MLRRAAVVPRLLGAGGVARLSAATSDKHGDIIAYWFPEEGRGERWFFGGEQVDNTIRERFGDVVEEALAGGLEEWEAGDSHQRLALVILLDQFTRNMFRKQAKAFSGDERARRVAKQTIALLPELKPALEIPHRQLLGMPLMHSEDVHDHTAAAAYFQSLLEDAIGTDEEQDMRLTVQSEEQHAAIIHRFGRYPHRNDALGRESTAEEVEYMKEGESFGQ
eukprot:PLAT14856.2.p1 GENE.PLAT14856.2~~PLAT14856.2.p1  ORF type:complete len:221 (-),score=79.35 PLAT14856.2:28-690(-)